MSLPGLNKEKPTCKTGTWGTRPDYMTIVRVRDYGYG